MKTGTVFLLLLFFLINLLFAQKPNKLTVELLRQPDLTVITDPMPELGWQFTSNKYDNIQTAYRILVSSSPDLISDNQGDIWDSGKVISNQSTNVSFGGEQLQSFQKYYWKIMLWDKDNTPSGYSDYQVFSTGDLTQEYTTTRYPLIVEKIKPVYINQKSNADYFIDFGKDAFGTLELTLESPKNDIVEIHLGEKLSAKETVDMQPGGTIRHRQIFLAVKAGEKTYRLDLKADKRNTGNRAVQIPETIGVVTPFRYCEVINLPSPIDSTTISQLAVFYPFDNKSADFTCSDTVLNQIWQLTKYSIKATSFAGVYVDGDRERIPYEADAYINQLGHYYVDCEYNIGRFTHEYLIKHPTWPTEWIMHSVLMAYADYMFTENSESLNYYYQDLKEKTLASLAREDGLISTRTGLVTDEVLTSIHLKDDIKDIVDWPEQERDQYEMMEINTVVNAFHYKSLSLMAKIANTLNLNDDENYYIKMAAKVKKSINSILLDKEKGLYIDGENSKHASLHANMFALAFDIVPEKYLKTVTAHIKSKGMACSVYGAQYLMEALYYAGEAEYALQLLTATNERSWWNMIKSGSTITMEAWDMKYKPNLDWNHAWGAVPANIIPRCLWGINPEEAGFSKFSIKPQFASLSNSEIKIPTIKGPIQAVYQGNNEHFTMKVEIPFNTKATIYLPNLNGKHKYYIDDLLKNGTGNEQNIIVELGSGNYLLDVKK